MDSRILQYFGSDLRLIIRNLGDNVTEIRLRKNAPLVVMIGEKRFFATLNGCLTSVCGKNCFIVSAELFHQTFEAVCRYSVHSFYNDICSGFITLEGGHRVGICGTAVMDGKNVANVKNISSLNFRIARSVRGCADDIYRRCFSVRPCNFLIAGAPARGKTTLLRDLCRCLGEHYKVSLIDSRGELASVYDGIPQNDVGVNTDVFNSYSRSSGIETAVRVMSPDLIVCDEIGEQDAHAVEYAMLCGVKVCTSVHGTNIADVKKKLPFYSSFDIIVFLSSVGNPGSISEIMEMSNYHENSINVCNSYSDNIDRSTCFVKSEKEMGVSKRYGSNA